MPFTTLKDLKEGADMSDEGDTEEDLTVVEVSPMSKHGNRLGDGASVGGRVKKKQDVQADEDGDKQNEGADEDGDETGSYDPNHPDNQDEDESDDDRLDYGDAIKELDTNEYEVVGLDGSITTVVDQMTEKEKQDEEERVAKATRDDPRFAEFGRRGAYRFACAIDTAIQLANNKDDKVLDFSETATVKDRKVKGRMVVCKVGRLQAEYGGVTGTRILRYRTLTDEEMEKLAELARMNGLDSPCDCDGCATRRKNVQTTFTSTKLRSGVKYGWEKYGEGHVLGK